MSGERLADDDTVEVREYYERGNKRVRCHECSSPLYPGKDGSQACDGRTHAPPGHDHVNVYWKIA